MTSSQPKTAVVILNWNGEKLLREFLPSIVLHTPDAVGRVIVADNGSTDDSVTYLRRAYPSGEIDIMELDRNYGFAEGYNRALAALKGKYEYALLLNSDVAASEDYLTPLVEFMDANPDVAAVAPKLLSYREPEKFEYAGAAGGFLDCNGYPYCRGRIFDTCEDDLGQYDAPIECDWATGAALLTRIDDYLDAGGLDPGFFAHMEEIDLCWRFRRMGRRVMCLPSARLFHLGGGSLPPSDPRKTYLNYRNNLVMLHKNLTDSHERRVTLLRRRLLDTIAWGMSVATLKWGAAAAIVRAHRDFRKMRRNYPHTSEQGGHPRSSDEAERPNIIVDYFLRRRHKFSQL